MALNQALRTGKIAKLPCEICGASKVQAHHPFGYSDEMALAVWWLCRPDHLGIYAL